MPKTSEPVINAALADALRRKHPLWHSRVHVEQSRVFQQAALRPAIIVDHPGGLPVVIETELEPARTVEKDAQSRLGRPLQILPGGVEQALAVRMPKGLATYQGRPDGPNRRRRVRVLRAYSDRHWDNSMACGGVVVRQCLRPCQLHRSNLGLGEFAHAGYGDPWAIRATSGGAVPAPSRAGGRRSDCRTAAPRSR